MLTTTTIINEYEEKDKKIIQRYKCLKKHNSFRRKVELTSDKPSCGIT